MPSRPTLPVLLVLSAGCAPLVPFGDDAATDGSSSSDSSAGGEVDGGDDARPTGEVGGDDGGEVGGEVGGDITTGAGSFCGDGFIDGDEICDDGNATPGDGCEPDCTNTAGLLLWSQTYDGGGDDRARDVAASVEGDLLVVGHLATATDDAWAQRVTADGINAAAAVLDLGDDEYATSVTVVADGAVWVAGSSNADGRALVMRWDEDQFSQVDGGPEDLATGSVFASTTGEGFAVIANTGGFNDFGVLARRFDLGGALIGDAVVSDPVFIGAAIPGPDGGTILSGNAFGGMGMPSTIWIGSIAADGSPGWSSSFEAEPGMNARVRGIAIAPDGRIVGVGTMGPPGQMGQQDRGWIWWWTADGVPDGDGPLDIGGAAARASAVVFGNHGMVVGGTTILLDDGFVAGLDDGGNAQWAYSLSGDLGLEDGITALAVVPGAGIAAVGWVAQSGTGEDAWVGLFSD